MNNIISHCLELQKENGLLPKDFSIKQGVAWRGHLIQIWINIIKVKLEDVLVCMFGLKL